MSGHNASRSIVRGAPYCVAVLLALAISGCGAKPSPDAATASNPAALQSPGNQAQAQASAYVGMRWSGPDRSSSTPEKSASPAPTEKLSTAEQLTAETTPQAFLAEDSSSSRQPPASPKRITTPAEGNLAAGIGNMVEVFYATDRLPTSQLMPSTWRTFAPVGVVWMICAALFIGFSAARRFTAFWLVGSGLAICLGMMVLHATIIRWQQYSRLARNAETRFSSVRDSASGDYPLHLGSARVSLPSIHKPGRFEQPKLYQFEFVETIDKHIVLHSLREQPSSAAWFDDLSSMSQLSERGDSFVFIHGYNVRFIDALKRTAQLAVDLELQGPAICYSWPSRGDVVAYATDEASVSWSAPHFEQLLLDLHARTQCRRVHVIAHSMGNRALLQAIERIDSQRLAGSNSTPENAAEPKLIDSLVMAAPDVDLAEFTSRYVQPLRSVSQRTTLYFSDSDRALLLSAQLHGAPRLGLLRDHLQAFAGIESVYVGAQASLTLGHSYYGDDPAVIEDLKTLLRDGQPAAKRELLSSATNANGDSFWKIDRRLQAQLPTVQAR